MRQPTLALLQTERRRRMLPLRDGFTSGHSRGRRTEVSRTGNRKDGRRTGVSRATCCLPGGWKAMLASHHEDFGRRRAAAAAMAPVSRFASPSRGHLWIMEQ